MKKRILSMLLCMALCLSLLPTAVFAAGTKIATVELDGLITDLHSGDSLTNYNFTPSGTAHFYVDTADWHLDNGYFANPWGHKVATPGFSYYLDISLNADEGYYFDMRDLTVPAGYTFSGSGGSSAYGTSTATRIWLHSKIFSIPGDTVKRTVRFDANGGTGTMEDLVIYDGFNFSFPKCLFTREGYEFDDWLMNGEKYKPDHYGPHIYSDVTVEATWKKVGNFVESITIYGIPAALKAGDVLRTDNLSVPAGADYSITQAEWRFDDGYYCEPWGHTRAFCGHEYYLTIGIKAKDGYSMSSGSHVPTVGSGLTLLASNLETATVGTQSWTIPAGHGETEVKNAKAATCFENGYTGDSCCKVCGQRITEGKPIPAKGHNYQNGKCTVCGAVDPNAKTVNHRLYNPYTLEHMFCSDETERQRLLSIGWTYDGIAFMTPASGKPVYRLYNPAGDWHTYSADSNEIASLENQGWSVDGVMCFSADSNGRPVYRMYNPYEPVNYLLFTSGTEERDWLVTLGWVYQGITWFVEK